MFVSLDVRLAPSRLLLLPPKTARVMRVEARPINPMLLHAFNVVTLATLPRPCNLCSLVKVTIPSTFGSNAFGPIVDRALHRLHGLGDVTRVTTLNA